MIILFFLCISILAFVNGHQQLFAVIGATQCAENLYYGPQSISKSGSADGQRPYYLSTATSSKNIPHTDWIQVVTSDGTTELFRIYWTFSTARTLAEHFSNAVSSGESVSYRIVDTANGGTEYYKSAIWRFSTGSRITTSTFNVAITTCCFSSDDGAWGAGSGTIQPDGASNNYYSTSFWGIGNWDSADSSDCGKVYGDGALLSYYPSSKTYMYYEDNTGPSALPTAAPSRPTPLPTAAPSSRPTTAPTQRPTAAPTTLAPTKVPSLRPTSSFPQTLFAVVGGSSCAEQLYYGPQSISTAGSADNQRPYFLSTSTAGKDVAHKEWLQIVTSDGTTELFRIYWIFSTARTLADRFQAAVSTGEPVIYEVHDAASGQVYTYSGTWWFSNGAGSMGPRFTATTTQCCFSSDDGAWGAGSGTIQGNGQPTGTSFWGIGNWDSGDSDCSRIYKQGTYTSYGSSVKAFMYYFADLGPTLAPSVSPTLAPSTLAPTLRPTVTSQTLFAVVGGSNCAEGLNYGSQAVTPAGSADGQHPYFLSTNTAGKDVAHTKWLQIVTSDGTTELFRIYWTFSTAKTLAQRFVSAVSSGEAVIYEVHDAASGQVYTYSGTWWFSNGAGSMDPRFSSTYSTQCCFSSDDGAWGAALGTVQANGNVAISFWGIGNWNSVDSECSRIYKLGTYTSYGSGTKSFMYYYADLGSSLAPTARPTPVPASVPTAAPTSSSELFAVVGGSSCAESLYYGPQAITKGGSADGKYPYFLSTSPPANSVAHTEWLQIVTSNDVEQFRIYWTFSTAKTLADRFQTAVSPGETVSWRVVDSTGAQYTYSATWRYSNGAGSMSPRFATSTTQCCFSSDDGAWGAGTSTVDGNGAMASAFWGIGNFDSSDSTCSNVYRLGSIGASSGGAVKVYIYAVMDSQPPAVSPTPAPGPVSAQTLFAVVGGSSCAESLYYGPQSITTAGSADGQYPYFLSTSTVGKDIPHKEWLQIVTSDGTTELFRIYWTFSTAKTLADRFQAAVSSGEPVIYEVHDAASGQVYTYTGTWWFSNGAGSMSPRFATSITACCFSSDDGAWGAGSGTIQANGNVGSSFWGIGNFDSGDSACSTVYRQGVSSSYGSSVKAYMYYSTTARYTLRPTVQPTAMPSAVPDQIRLHASQAISGVSYSDYQTNQAVYDSVLQQTIVDSVSGISRSSIQDFLVTAGSSRNTLSEASSLRSPAGPSNPAPLSSSTAASIRAQYRLVLTGTGRSYDDVRTQLEGAVQSGSFDASLRSNALAQGAAGLSNATSGSLSVQDETDYSSDDDSSGAGVFTLPVIIGVAGGAGALLVIAFLFYFRAWCSVSEQLPSTATAGSSPVETSRRLEPTHLDPSAAKDISQYFYGGGLTQQPWDQALVPSAPPDTSDCGIELGTTIGSDDHHYEPNNSSAPTLDSIYPHRSSSPSIPVAAVAVPVSVHGPYMPGESVVFAQVYTGEIEEAKD